jgi:hypothetical protein
MWTVIGLTAIVSARLALIALVPSVLLATALLAVSLSTAWCLDRVFELAELAGPTLTGVGSLLGMLTGVGSLLGMLTGAGSLL